MFTQFASLGMTLNITIIRGMTSTKNVFTITVGEPGLSKSILTNV